MKIKIMLSILIVLASAIFVSAVTPTMVQGSPTCPSIGLARAVVNTYVITANYHYDVTGIGLMDIKVWQSGRFTYVNDPGFVRAIILKGGANANIYYYPNGSTGDYEITTPINSNGGYYNIEYYEVCYAPRPTAANVTVSGRILSQSDTGVNRASVQLTDYQGATRTVTTNQFGYYKFNAVAAGQSYTLSVSAKGYSFNSMVFELSDELSDLNILSTTNQ